MPSSRPAALQTRPPIRAALLAMVAAIGTLAPGAARATVVFDTTLSSLPGDSRVILLDLGSGTGDQKISGATGYFGGANSVSFAGAAGIYHGTVSSVAAAPTLNGSKITTNYFAAEPSGDVTFSYTSPQKFFGLLWGSVDGYNGLSFYDGSALVASFAGNQITTNPTGSQLADGSFFVSFNFTNSSQFTRVVATSTSAAFEFNSMAYSPTNIPVVTGTGSPSVVALSDTPTLPAPGAVAILPGLLALMLLRRRGLTRQRATHAVA